MKSNNFFLRLKSLKGYLLLLFAIIIVVSIVYNANEQINYSVISPVKYLFLALYFGYGYYTLYAFIKDFKNNLMFGVTRKEYYQRYLKNIIFVFLLVVILLLVYYLTILFNELITKNSLNVFDLIIQDKTINLLCYIPFICGVSLVISNFNKNKDISVISLIIICLICVLFIALTFIEMKLLLSLIISVIILIIGLSLLFINKKYIMKREF